MNEYQLQLLLAKRKRTSHVLHLLLSLLTLGLWVPVWLLVALSNANENRKVDRELRRLARQ